MKRPHLRIDSHVVIQLGAELISDSEQALLELVKNAYDADASKCVIILDPSWMPEKKSDYWHDHLHDWAKARRSKSIGRIIVMDDGTGIDESGIEDGWLYISASLKRVPLGEKVPTEEKNRIPVGDKGLGRLATMRLGEILQLRTQTKADKEARMVSFAWSSFATGEPLEQVPVQFETGGKLSGRSRGTNVEILGLSEPEYWQSENNVNTLLGKLSTLISPFQRFKDFRVNVRSNDQELDLQSISAEALNFASAKFEFSYADGKLKLKAYIAKSLFRGQSGQTNRQVFDELLSEKNIAPVLLSIKKHSRVAARNFRDLHLDPGGWLFSLEEELDWADIPREPKLQGATDPGPFNGEIYNFLFNDQTKEQLVGANVPLSVLQGMTTIGMFRDGFRVRMSDDWLELAKSVTSGGFFQLRPRNVIGYFSLTNKDNPRLVEKSDREGFVDNECWRGFVTLANRTKKFANDSLDAVRTAYDDYKKSLVKDVLAKAPVTREERDAHISSQEEKAKQSLQTLLQRNDALSERVADTKKKVADLRSSPGKQSEISVIVGELEDIEEDLVEVRERVESAVSATRSGFSIAGDLALAHGQLEERNLRLLDAAAVGLSARALVHEINTHLNHLSRAISMIAGANKAQPNEKISKAVSSISDVLRELKKTVSSIDPLSPGSRTLKSTLDVYEVLVDFLRQREGRSKMAGVDVRLTGRAGLKISFSHARFLQILENLFQNSIYWLEEHGAEDKKSEKYIQIEVDESGFFWRDGAKGIRVTLEDSLFEPYVTDKPLSKGQGLGLFIVNSYLQAERCTIALLHERNKFKRRYVFRVDLSGAVRR